MLIINEIAGMVHNDTGIWDLCSPIVIYIQIHRITDVHSCKTATDKGVAACMVNNSREEAYYSDRHPGAGLF